MNIGQVGASAKFHVMKAVREGYYTPLCGCSNRAVRKEEVWPVSDYNVVTCGSCLRRIRTAEREAFEEPWRKSKRPEPAYTQGPAAPDAVLTEVVSATARERARNAEDQ